MLFKISTCYWNSHTWKYLQKSHVIKRTITFHSTKLRLEINGKHNKSVIILFLNVQALLKGDSIYFPFFFLSNCLILISVCLLSWIAVHIMLSVFESTESTLVAEYFMCLASKPFALSSEVKWISHFLKLSSSFSQGFSSARFLFCMKFVFITLLHVEEKLSEVTFIKSQLAL